MTFHTTPLVHSSVENHAPIVTGSRLLAGAVACGLLAACGDPISVNVSSAGGPGGAGGSATSSGTGGDVFPGGGPSGAGAGGPGGGESCAGETSKAELVPLDMYILLDSSGSMSQKAGAGQGTSKWSAVTKGLVSFFDDPQSKGIGVGLQYFPLMAPGVPAVCTSDAQCGQFGPCYFKACDQTGDSCSSDADCSPGEQCATLGYCTNGNGSYCTSVGSPCPNNQGTCMALTMSHCAQQDSCASADYATPAVEIAPLNGAAGALQSSIASKSPQGETPTAPALQGAIDHARDHATAHPGHAVVAVLATDGFPTVCEPTSFGGLVQIAAGGFAGAAGAPSVPTFVIGVFSGNDQSAKNNLDALAAAGGTEQSFFIDVAGDVTQSFIDALNVIRGKKLACEYAIPQPSGGGELDYQQVNVQHTPEGATSATTIPYVGSAAGCDPVNGGWYYDVDPAGGGVPSKIVVCQETCNGFGVGGQIEIEVGCKTVSAVPK